MAVTIGHPGVYIDEIPKFPPSVAAVETAIPVFVGYTQIALNGTRDLTNTPWRITSVFEYEQFFGTASNEENISVEQLASQVVATNSSPSVHNMYYAIQAFYANGGGPCYIISVGPMQTGPDDALTDTNVVADELIAGIDAAEKVDEITLFVVPEAASLAAIDDPSDDAGANNYSDYRSVMERALAQCEKLKDRFVILDVPQSDVETVANLANLFRGQAINEADDAGGVGVNDLKYGAAYFPYVETVFDYIYDEADVEVTPLEEDAVSMDLLNPANPDAATPNAPLYAQAQQAIGLIPVILPPSPLIAGIYARVDSTRGVWKAPANVSLSAGGRPTINITDAQQDSLNIHTSGKSINAIRSFAGRGNLVWGARTLAGNDNEWRYINVRRFFNFVEESVKKASEQFVFEPNDRNTWVRIRSMIENFLLIQWRAGALAGAIPEDAFFVRVGLPETMTSLDILEGRMNVEIGMAVVRPAEFIILKFSHKMQVS